MIRAIVGTSLRLRYIVILLAGAMMVYGITKFPHMPVDVFPEFAPVRVEVQTATNGLSAEENRQLAMSHRPGEVASLVALGLGRLRQQRPAQMGN